MRSSASRFGLSMAWIEMHAAALVGEHVRDEQALIELAAFFGALLHQRALGVDTLPRRQHAWKTIGHGIEQLAYPQCLLRLPVIAS